MTAKQEYETVIGLEVHARLLTRSKLFCGDSSVFGDEPNTNISPITLAHPGTLPKMNKEAIGFAVKLGLACHSEIEKQNYFARKNYFYPDLPKGYQVSQHTTPICKGGHVTIKTAAGEKNVQLNRIHMEEDAGKSMHDVFADETALDYNRAGVPLLEIVSEPDLRSGDEAHAYLTELRKLVRYLEICDGNMEEGSLRCDANISVRKTGDNKLGTRVEVKNLNSIRNVKIAIEYEASRLILLSQNGETIQQQTRSFDAANGTTFPIRDKEDAEDYRYFPEPDLTPFDLTDGFIASVKESLPVLQKERIKKYISGYQLSEYDATALTEEKEFSNYFEQLILSNNANGTNAGIKPKSAANWMLGPVKTWLNDENKNIGEFPVSPAKLNVLIKIVEENKLSFSAASSKIFPLLIEDPDSDPLKEAAKMNLIMESNSDYILPIADAVLLQFEDKVKEYRKGKKGLLALFVGEVIKRSKGKADPKVVNEILNQKLNS
ncbi:MAG TPA: Asp-tRNA(Asn)/Glu-tRNA(Gln) amidotransferase subunit GatB [Chitinophagaceae bacterium]|jgi:aspartyl-tRNA(Asn)/glutamyl-tRNA(Gln) amidotransferase subunit B|nr:Asp-tRNA(Asn)/Glu-tRNA(Gln) amidotransferase subunit GatB [Chitinophagaceae bacterium]